MKTVFCWNFWGPPISSSCDNNYSYVKHVSFKSVIFGRYKMIKNPLRIHAKSLSDALAPSKTQIACAAALRRLCEASAFIAGVPIVCQIPARNPSSVLSQAFHQSNFAILAICPHTLAVCVLWSGPENQLCFRVHPPPLAGASTTVHSSLILQTAPSCYVCWPLSAHQVAKFRRRMTVFVDDTLNLCVLLCCMLANRCA